MILGGGSLVTADGVVPGWVRVTGARIDAIGHGAAPDDDADLVDVRGLLVMPGLVDVHQHGAGGASYDEGPAAAEEVVLSRRRSGTTSCVASLASAPIEVLEARLSSLAPLVASGLLAGVHLEGPWLNPARAGAHDRTALIDPFPEDVARLLAAGDGAVGMVTLAPELPGGLAAVEQLTGAGVVVAIGHTEATYATTRDALARGATAGTHLYNAMRPVHHREPGPVVALLESGAAIELVGDGVHLHPAVLGGTARLAGPGRVVLVTDAMAAAGMPDGRYRLADREVTVSDGVARGAGGELAGSTITLADAVRFAVAAAGVPLHEAVTAASAAPADLLGLPGVGRLTPGAWADVVLMTPDLQLLGVLFRGEWERPLPGRDA